MESTKKLSCRELPTNAAQRNRQNHHSKEVYTIDKKEGIVRLLLKDTEFGDIRTMAVCGKDDKFDEEIGMRVAKLKAVRRLAQLTKIRICESIKNKEEDIRNLELLYRRQERTIKRMDKIIPRCGNGDEAKEANTDKFLSV